MRSLHSLLTIAGLVCALIPAFPAAAQQIDADSATTPEAVAALSSPEPPAPTPIVGHAGTFLPSSLLQDTEEEEQDPDRMIVRWRDGLRMTSADGRFEMRIGGRLQTDVSYISDREPFGGRLGTVEPGLEVRRARLGVQGHMYDRIEYKMELDFAGGSVGGNDMYIGVRDWPVVARFGHVKEPYSIEELNSSRFITFMERSVANLFAPSRNTGILVGSGFADGRASWSAGVFRDTDGFAASTGDNYNLTGRLTYAPIRNDDSNHLLHLGAAVQHRFVDGILRLSARPGDHNAPRIIDIKIPATSATFVNFEAAANIGPLHLQGEYHSVSVSSVERNDPHLSGFYVQAGYFITGETRPYRNGGTFDRLRPKANFLDGGGGAWELAVRYAKIDLSEAALEPPGQLSDVTIGVNWYWNPHLRWMLNYEIDDLPDVDVDKVNILHARLSLDF